eukprot:scaffold50138_cov61-Phaeocystis_antarctica.AAC.4
MRHQRGYNHAPTQTTPTLPRPGRARSPADTEGCSPAGRQMAAAATTGPAASIAATRRRGGPRQAACRRVGGEQRVPAARHTWWVLSEAGPHWPGLGTGLGWGRGSASHLLERRGWDDERPTADQHHHHAPAALGKCRHERGVVAPQRQVQGVAACSGWGAE